MRDILHKFTSNQPITGVGNYNDFDSDGTYEPNFSDYIPNPNTLDLYDRQLLAADIKREKQTIEDRQKAYQDATKLKAQERQAMYEKFEKSLAEKPTVTNEPVK